MSACRNWKLCPCLLVLDCWRITGKREVTPKRRVADHPGAGRSLTDRVAILRTCEVLVRQRSINPRPRLGCLLDVRPDGSIE